MRVHAAGIVELLVRDGIPEPWPGPDGTPRPPIPLGRRVELRGRGTTFVREVAGPADTPDAGPLARLVGERRPQLVPGVRGAGHGVQRPRARPAGPCPGAPLARCLPTLRLCRRRRRAARRADDRSGARGGLLDGRAGGAPALAAPPRAGLRSGAVRGGTAVPARRRRRAPDRRRARRRRQRGEIRRAPRARAARARCARCARAARRERRASWSGRSASSGGTTRASSSKRRARRARSTPAPGCRRSTLRPRSS